MRWTKRFRWRIGFFRLSLRQVRTQRPPKTHAAYVRLRLLGLSRWRAYRLLTAALEAEVATMLLETRVWDHAQFVSFLDALPTTPRVSLRTLGRAGRQNDR